MFLWNRKYYVFFLDMLTESIQTCLQVVIYIVDKGAGGLHISASELATFLNTGVAKTNLTNAGCSSITPVTRPTPQMLEQYLQNPPPGMVLYIYSN